MPTPKMTRTRVVEFYQRLHRTGWPANGMSLDALAETVREPLSTLNTYLYRYSNEYNVNPREPGTWTGVTTPTPAVEGATLEACVRAAIRKAPMTLEQIAAANEVTTGAALDCIEALKRSGANVHREGEHYVIHSELVPAFAGGARRRKLVSDKHNRFRFGVMADSHLGSKYERLDCLHDSYNRFERAGISHVMHCGNWIEGEARFNRTDVKVHGMDAQLRYLAQNYPHRKGIQTWAVAGDDHEGWYAQREACNIGEKAEDMMHRHNRFDWHDLGFMEAHVELVNANTGKSAILAVVHPGGGSAYADSYVVQKIIESLDGGEKPAVALYGHYHKCLAGQYRNVWWVLVPSTKDQDVFMRKKRLRSVVGGGIIGLEQDPETGAITGMTPQLWQYFNKGYYNDRWSHSGEVVLPERLAA
jgi:predicted phosphodiesterase